MKFCLYVLQHNYAIFLPFAGDAFEFIYYKSMFCARIRKGKKVINNWVKSENSLNFA